MPDAETAALAEAVVRLANVSLQLLYGLNDFAIDRATVERELFIARDAARSVLAPEVADAR